MTRPRVVLPILLGAITLASILAADEPATAAGSPALGRTVFRVYCASCHGQEAKGDGNIAKYLTVKPADLTGLAAANDGQFPTERVYEVVDGRKTVPGHGNSDMPVWGDVFQKADALEAQPPEVREVEVQRRIEHLVAFLASIQEGAAEGE